MNIFEGEELNYPLPFRVDGALVPPDPGTAVCSIYGHDGMLLQQTNPTGTHQVILGGLNEITPPREFEKRTVIVSFQYFGVAHRVRSAYRITPSILYSATPEDVRQFIGVTDDELPDAAIDLFHAYTQLRGQLTVAVLNPALVSGTLLELNANEALVMLAVLSVIPSLQQRVKQSEADGLYQFKRQTLKDYTALEAAARARLGVLIGDIDPNLDTGNVALIQVISGQDIITGEG